MRCKKAIHTIKFEDLKVLLDLPLVFVIVIRSGLLSSLKNAFRYASIGFYSQFKVHFIKKQRISPNVKLKCMYLEPIFINVTIFEACRICAAALKNCKYYSLDTCSVCRIELSQNLGIYYLSLLRNTYVYYLSKTFVSAGSINPRVDPKVRGQNV